MGIAFSLVFKHRLASLFKRIRPTTIFLVLILLVASFFRFYNTPMRYSIGDDSSRDALVAFEGARQLQLPLTGPFSSLGPFTFGPWYYIQLIFFTLLTQIPYAPWVYIGFSSILFVLVMYLIGKEVEGEYLGLVTAFLTAISPIQIVTGVSLSNAWNVALFAGLGLLAFLKTLKVHASYWWGLVLGVTIGLAISAHYSAIPLLLFSPAILLYRPKYYKYFIASLIGLSIVFLPIVIFDLNNHWFTLRNVMYSYIHMKERIYVANSWTIYLRDFWPKHLSDITGLSIPIAWLITVSSAVSFLFTFYQKTLKTSMKLLVCIFMITFLQLRYYGGERSISYLQYLQPFLLLFLAYPIAHLYKMRYGAPMYIAVLTAVFLLALPVNISALKSPLFEEQIHTISDKLVNLNPHQKYSTFTCGDTATGKMQALMLVLNIDNRLDTVSGAKIGFADPVCSKKGAVVIENDLLDLSKVDTVGLAKSGWIPLTPEGVHAKTVRWWIQNRFDK
ncbi:MAG: hypothetical protein WCJ70_03965 [bacterium]